MAASPSLTRPLRRTILWTLVVLAALAGARTLYRTVGFLRSQRVYERDFIQEYALAEALRVGVNPYRRMGDLTTELLGHLPSPYVRRHPSAHPPSVAIAFLPITLLPYKYASFTWLLIELGGLLMCVKWLGVLCGMHASPHVLPVLTLGALCLPPVASEIMQGQLGIVLLLLLVSTWRSLRSDAPLRAGAFLGCAVALKLTGWPIMLFLLFRAQWRSASAAAFVVMAMNLAAIVAMGPARVLEYYLHVGPSIAELYRDESANLSAWTLGWRLFAETGSGGLNSLRAGPLIAWPSIASGVSLAIVGLLLAASFAVTWRAKEVDDWFGVLVCTSILVNPVVWSHTLILLAIPIALIVVQLRATNYPLGPVALLLGLIGLVIIPNPVWHLSALTLAHEAPWFGNPAQIPFSFTLLTLVPQLATLGLLALLAQVTRMPKGLRASSGRTGSAVGPRVASPS